MMVVKIMPVDKKSKIDFAFFIINMQYFLRNQDVGKN